MTASKRVQNAWAIAGNKLGFEFVGPFHIEERGKKTSYHGFVRGFGSKKSTLFFASERFDEDFGPALALAKKKGFFYSRINAAVYNSYDEEVFVEVLADWGWFGKPETCPKWLKRKPA